MKKFTIVIAISILVSISTIGFAAEEEILFREIPWETDYPSVSSIYPENYFWLNSDKYGWSTDDLITIGDTESMSSMDCEIVNLRASSNDSSLIVGGHQVDRMILYFAYLPSEREQYDQSQTSLYAAEYRFEPSSYEIDDVANDLVTKLLSVYGEADTINTVDNYNGAQEFTYYYWYGANSTVVALQKTVSNITNRYTVRIVYGCEEGNKLLVPIEYFDTRGL